MQSNNNCQILSHEYRRINTICFDTQCKGKKQCCQLCQNEFHKFHIEKLVDVDYFRGYILKHSQNPSVLSSQINQALQELTRVQNYLDQLSQLIQLEMERLSSYSSSQKCLNIGNQYNILEIEILSLDPQKQNHLIQDMLQYFDVKNGTFIEKSTLVGQLGKAYLLFMNQFSQIMIRIVKEFQIKDKDEDEVEKVDNFLNFTQNQYFIGHKDLVCGVDICKQRNLLVSGSLDQTVKVWDLRDSSLINTFKNSGPVQDVVLSNQGTLLAFAGFGNYIITLLDITDLRNPIISELKGHIKVINKLAFSNDSKYLFSGSSDQTVKVWDINTKKQTSQLDSESKVEGVAISKDDSLLASNSANNIRVWKLKNSKLLCSQTNIWNYGKGVSFSNDKNIIVTSHRSGLIRVWSLKELNKEKLVLINEFQAATITIQTVLFSPCSKYIISMCNGDKEIRIMDSQTGLVLKSFKSKSLKIEFNQEIYCDANDIAISQDMNMIAYGEDNTIVILREQ